MQIEYEMSEQDFLAAQKLAMKNLPKRTTRLMFRLLPFWGVFIFIAVAWPVFQRGFTWKTEMLVPLAFGVLALASPLLMKRALQKAYRKNRSLQGKRTLVMNENGLDLSGATFSAQLNWQHFIRFVEDDKSFLLYQSSQVFHIIPKRELTAEQISEVREEFTRHIAKQG